jgi:hypothetical protein
MSNDIIKQEYKDQNAIVHSKMEDAIKWITAVKAIKEKKLYLAIYKSFDDYIAAELPLAKSRVYALLGPKERNIKIGSKCPMSGHIAPKLTEIESEEYDDVIVVFDQTRRQVPPELATMFDKANKEAEAILRKVYELNAEIIAQIKDDDKAWERFNRSEFNGCMKDIKALIKFCRPHAWCPVCGGDGGVGGGCARCKGIGWLIKMAWECIPEDMKQW